MTEAADLPPHAYRPGQTPRHPPGRFDSLRASARPGMTPDELAGCAAFRTGLAYLDAGFFWEAHEVLEPVWLACKPNSAERQLSQGLIQFANAALKAAMGRHAAAHRLCAAARAHIQEAAQGGRSQVLGLILADLAARIDSLDDRNRDAI